MKLDRLLYNPHRMADFYMEALTALGALCERTWHDRLEVVAEGEAARLWNRDGAFHEVELWFPPSDAPAPREAAKEVFPGCPLTFLIADALRPVPLTLQRAILVGERGVQAPLPAIAEKLWRVQFPDTARWQMTGPFRRDYHFSLMALVRCEIQAIDQHWSLRRVAVSMPDGNRDDSVAQDWDLAKLEAASTEEVPWPSREPTRWREWLQRALEVDLALELVSIRNRQEQYLRRELDRVDQYFEHYQQELGQRNPRSATEAARTKSADRLAAARAEHARRRADQVARHEIHVHGHIDSLVLIAESAWRASVKFDSSRQQWTGSALFIPRSRRWARTEMAGASV